jgi:hypothetical protein
MPETMVRDVHPAEVSLSDGRLISPARVFITSERLIIWKEDKERNISKVLETAVTFTDSEKTRNSLNAGQRIEVYSDEVTAIINKGLGCGCHSKLKALGTPVPWSKR